MSRFNTAGEVEAWAAKAAAEDYARHLAFGVDLNPFCTPGARSDWQRGFDNLGPRSYELSVDFDTIYQRGRAAAKIMDRGFLAQGA